jgi:hypothetical protein
MKMIDRPLYVLEIVLNTPPFDESTLTRDTSEDSRGASRFARTLVKIFATLCMRLIGRKSDGQVAASDLGRRMTLAELTREQLLALKQYNCWIACIISSLMIGQAIL